MQKDRTFVRITFYFVVASMAISLCSMAWKILIGHQGKYSLVAAEVAAGLLLVLVPAFLSRIFRFQLPTFLYFFFMAFIYCAIYLGDAYRFYYIPYWDKFLHLISGALLLGLGFAVLGLLQKQPGRLSPAFLCLYGIAFAVFCGVLWEFYEFSVDSFFAMNLQRYAAKGRDLPGRAALMDTMGDLFADAACSALFSLYAYWRLKKDPAWLTSFFFKKS